MTLRQREPRVRDRRHIDFVNKLPCCVCGSTRNVEAAHVRMANAAIGKRETGKAEKPHDYFVVPLCHYHHQSGILAQHKIGEQRFWFEVHGRNPFEIAASLWIISGAAARALEPKPAKRTRRIPERKSPDLRTKIRSRQTFPQGRKIQSRGFERRPS